MRILLPTDVFPPDGRGGAAWSSHALALGLQARGHQVLAVVPGRDAADGPYDARGVPALRVGYHAPRLPFIQNYFRHERFWPRFAAALISAADRLGGVDLIHAQHTQAAAAAVIAARRLRVPVVVTVRDHWPWDYFATGLHGDRIPHPGGSWAALVTDLPARLGPLRGAAALAAVPYMLAHLRRRAALLAQADAVIAPSHYIAAKLERIVAAPRIHVIPNMVDIAANDTLAAAEPQTRVDGPFLLFVGKLEANKGAALLPAVWRAIRRLLPPAVAEPTLVIAGDGVLREPLLRELQQIGGRVQALAWADHSEVLRLTARCRVLLFPSAWGEPLSRVLLEAAALGAPIVAMPTGGTTDVVIDELTGLLAVDSDQLAARAVAVLTDDGVRRRLSRAARHHALQRFSSDRLLPAYEHLYQRLSAVTARPGSPR
jgi:glycogen synthase